MKASIVNRGYRLVVALVLTMYLVAPTLLSEVVNAELPEQSSIPLESPNGECEDTNCNN